MDIDSTNFWHALPVVLEAIANAEIVSLDLEMTGIQSKRVTATSRLTLEEAYHQAKRGANLFQIIQVGLTCIHCKVSGTAAEYVTQTFNIYISPLFISKGHSNAMLAKALDRTVSFSYASLLFLQDHDFSFGRAFSKGVPYLSRLEENEARRQLLERDNSLAEVDAIDMATQDVETQSFYDFARGRISQFCGNPNREFEVVNIENPHGGRLNRLQVRLIHQLVASEFPGYKAHAKNNSMFMQVTEADSETEEMVRQKNGSERKTAIGRQTGKLCRSVISAVMYFYLLIHWLAGFRFIIEAIVGGNFAKDIELDWLLGDMDDATRAEQLTVMTKSLKEWEMKLKAQRPIFVGHNPFYDLCFLFRSFIGPLPDLLDDFRQQLHKLFPRIVDTKYLMTRDKHDMMADDTLAEAFNSLKHQVLPTITAEAEYSYGRASVHEAGYDSWMTGFVFLRLSYNLSNPDDGPPAGDGKEIEEDNGISESYSPEPESTEEAFWQILDPDNSRHSQQHSPCITGSLIQASQTPPELMMGTLAEGPSGRDESASSINLLDGDDECPKVSQTLDAMYGVLKPSPIGSKSRFDLAVKDSAMIEPGTGRGRLPALHSSFWNIYANKVRVGNSGVIDLGEF